MSGYKRKTRDEIREEVRAEMTRRIREIYKNENCAPDTPMGQVIEIYAEHMMLRKEVFEEIVEAFWRAQHATHCSPADCSSEEEHIERGWKDLEQEVPRVQH